MKIDVQVVNAFVANGEGGNPAGVVLNASHLSDDEMQQIATEVGASETAFVLSAEEATYRFRFFTPTVEVSLCGHATIAAWSLMQQRGLHAQGNFTQQNSAGLIKIEVDPSGPIFMEQPIQEIGSYINVKTICTALGIPITVIDESYKPQIFQKNLMVPVMSKNILNNLKLDTAKVKAFSEDHDFVGLHLFALLSDEDSFAAVRDFCPVVGIVEDPATGTANGSFLAYLKHNDALASKETYRIEQGEALGRLSYIYGKFKDDRVWIGGTAMQAKGLHVELT